MATASVARNAWKYGVRHRASTAYGEIRRAILTARFRPGTQLVERALGDHFGFSRTPVRNALAKLESDGLVERIPHVGVFVRKLGTKEAMELMQVRRALEGAAAAAAAARVSDKEADALCKLGSEIEVCAERGDLPRKNELELAFHQLVGELSGNAEIIRALSNVRGVHLTLTLFSETADGALLHEAGKNCANHADVAEAIAGGDPRLALLAMWDHFEDLYQKLCAALKAAQD